jgi:hypothetical protein
MNSKTHQSIFSSLFFKTSNLLVKIINSHETENAATDLIPNRKEGKNTNLDKIFYT